MVFRLSNEPVSPAMFERVGELLGRKPRGLEAVPVIDEKGGPVVIRVASLVDDKPFPTLFWLVDPQLGLRIDREEAGGLIARLQRQIDASASLQAGMREDHERHIALRDSYLSRQDRQRLEALGFGAVLQQKGIGGLGDFGRIRCLHTWYAAHLVEPNTVGRLLDEHWAGSGQD